MSLLKINNVSIKEPSAYSVSIYDLDSEAGGTGRNQNGDLTRDRVAVKHKINCTFPPMYQDEMSTLLNAVTDVFFNLTYLDPKDGVKTIVAYVGDREAPIYMYSKKHGKYLYNSFKMNFIER